MCWQYAVDYTCYDKESVELHEFTIEAMVNGYHVYSCISCVGGDMGEVLLVLHSQAKINC